jgi:hypothetical protein
MRVLLFAFFLLNSLFVLSQPFNITDVHSVDSFSKDELYKKIIYWAAESFDKGQSSIVYKSEEEGIVLLKAAFKYNPKDDYYRGVVTYHLKIYVKDNKIKLEMYDFFHDGDLFDMGFLSVGNDAPFKNIAPKKYRDREWAKFKSNCIDFNATLTNMILEHLKKKSNSEDW